MAVNKPETDNGTWHVVDGNILVFLPNEGYVGDVPEVDLTFNRKDGTLVNAKARGTYFDPENDTWTPPVVPTPKGENGSSKGTAERCFANAVRSPITWLLPIGLLGYIGNELAAPFIGVYQQQLNQVNAELQAKWNEAIDRNRPDWGRGGNGRDNSRQNDAVAQFQAQINQINGQIQQFAGRPEVQTAGQVLGAIVAIAALGGLFYDWCTAEPGKAVTAIDFGNPDAKIEDKSSVNRIR